MTRLEIFDEWKEADVTAGDGLAFRTDADVTQLYYAWKKQGEARGAHVDIEEQDKLVVTPPTTPYLE